MEEAEVRDFLQGLNLASYADVLIEEGFDQMQYLRLITEEDCRAIGLKVGHRRALLAALKEPPGVGAGVSAAPLVAKSTPAPKRPLPKMQKNFKVKAKGKMKLKRKMKAKRKLPKSPSSAPTVPPKRLPPKPVKPVDVYIRPDYQHTKRGSSQLLQLRMSSPGVSQQEKAAIAQFLSFQSNPTSGDGVDDFTIEGMTCAQRMFVHHLGILINLYLRPIISWANSKKKKKQVKTDFSAVFVSSGPLLRVHGQFLEGLSKGQDLSVLFSNLSAYSNVLVDYLRAYQKVLVSLVECEKSSSFHALLESAQHKGAGREFCLRDLLVMPARRIEELHTTLQGMAERMAPEDEKYTSVRQSLASCASLVDQLSGPSLSADPLEEGDSAMAVSEFTKEQGDQVSLAAYSLVQVLLLEAAPGWTKIRLQGGAVGVVPASILRKAKDCAASPAGADCAAPRVDSSHLFKEVFFTKPTYCSFCGKFIWGVVSKQGFVCRQCKFPVHRKCISLVKADCGHPDSCLGLQLKGEAREEERREEEQDTIFSETKHEFKYSNVTRATTCDVCSKQLLLKQVMQCTNCGCSVHKKCFRSTASKCRAADLLRFTGGAASDSVLISQPLSPMRHVGSGAAMHCSPESAQGNLVSVPEESDESCVSVAVEQVTACIQCGEMNSVPCAFCSHCGASQTETLTPREKPELPPRPPKWRVGDQCLAQFNDDMMWYAAEIVDTDFSGEEKQFYVVFIDYLNQQSCSESQLADLPEDLYQMLQKQQEDPRYTMCQLDASSSYGAPEEEEEEEVASVTAEFYPCCPVCKDPYTPPQVLCDLCGTDIQDYNRLIL